MRTGALERTVTAVVAMFAFLPSAFTASSTPPEALAAKGAALVAEHCSRCHAITKTDVSRHDQAPPFRDVMLRYPAEDLAEALAEGIVSGHPDMPVLTFAIDDIDAMIAYLNTLHTPSITP